MYRQPFLKGEPDELIHAIPAGKYAEERTTIYGSPFHTMSVATVASRFLFYCVRIVIGVAEKIIGKKLYVENDLRELILFRFSTRKLLVSLIKKGIVASWARIPLTPDQPPVLSCTIHLHPIRLPSGQQYTLHGSEGEGSGSTIDEALTRALAEALERHSLSTWNPEVFLRGSFEELKKRGAVDPKVFAFFSKAQLAKSAFIRSRITPSQKFGWVRAHSLTEKKQCLVPAQLAYIFYDKEYPDDPIFWESTTSGAAAGRTFEEAAYRAICEAIERDSFLIFWLNNIAPPQIDLESIDSPYIRNYITTIKRFNLELFLFDTTTDLSVPAFAVMLVDRFGEIALSVNAIADFDVLYAIEKVCTDTLRFLHIPPENIAHASAQKKYPFIETIEERHALWADQNMLPHIDFFLKGKKKHFSEIFPAVPDAHANDVATHFLLLKKILQKKKHACYIIDVTSPEAQKAGLVVVKAVLPQLVPLHFKEEKKYLGIKRLYSAPLAMQCRKRPLKESELNVVPHPFI